MSHHKRAASPATVILSILLVALAVFGFPAAIWAAIAWAFPAVGLTYWQTVALYLALRVATLHLQPVRVKKVAQ